MPFFHSVALSCTLDLDLKQEYLRNMFSEDFLARASTATKSEFQRTTSRAVKIQKRFLASLRSNGIEGLMKEFPTLQQKELDGKMDAKEHYIRRKMLDALQKM